MPRVPKQVDLIEVGGGEGLDEAKPRKVLDLVEQLLATSLADIQVPSELASTEPWNRYTQFRDLFDRYLDAVAKVGLPAFVADWMKLDYGLIVETTQHAPEFAQRLEQAIEAGEMRLLEWMVLSLPMNERGCRLFKSLLMSKRPSRYAVRTILSKKEVDKGEAKEIARQTLAQVLMSLEGVDDDLKQTILQLADKILGYIA